MRYTDSVGNVYDRLPPKDGGKPKHTAKKTRNKEAKRAISKAKKAKHDRYRANIGRPLGPGQPGNKSGKNRVTR